MQVVFSIVYVLRRPVKQIQTQTSYTRSEIRFWHSLQQHGRVPHVYASDWTCKRVQGAAQPLLSYWHIKGLFKYLITDYCAGAVFSNTLKNTDSCKIFFWQKINNNRFIDLYLLNYYVIFRQTSFKMFGKQSATINYYKYLGYINNFKIIG